MKKIFSKAELAECAYECYRDRVENKDGFMCEDFLEDAAPGISSKYIRLHRRERWRFLYAISEIVYDNLRLFQAHYDDPDNLNIERQIYALLDMDEFMLKE